jgi:putative glutamine amidotransferase
VADPADTHAPLIGLTTYGPEVEGLLASFSLPQPYVDAVSASGGIPVLLTPSATPVEALLDRLDGLIIAGGGDLDPALYRGDEHETVYMVNETRDRFELAITHAALQRQSLPVLGICRGSQVLNLARGGDLEVHVPDAFGETILHRLPPREPARHDVRLDLGCALRKIYEATEFPVCSWHHQSVKRLGNGVRAVAWAPDGVVEAIELDDHPWALGVQWHPEMQLPEEPMQKRLFDALVTSARARARTQR